MLEEFILISVVSVFIYSMPGYSVSIKERMLYSSCKNSVVDVLERIYSIPVDKKVEVDSGEELTEEFLMVTPYLTLYVQVRLNHLFSGRTSSN